MNVNRVLRPALALCLVAALLVAGSGPVAGQDDAKRSLVVNLEEDGSAELTLTITYDLADQEERDAFEELQDDAEAREDIRRRYLDRMQSVAHDAENATGRTMAVTSAAVNLRTTDNGETGIVELTVDWDGLAAVEDGTLVVTEPFASGFEPDRTFTVSAPEGYEVATVTPEPDSSDATSVTYERGTSLEGFEATFAESDGGLTDTDLPGFGLLVAAVAILLVALRLR